MTERKPQLNTTIDPELLKWIDEVHWKMRIPKTKLIERALRFYKKHRNPLEQEIEDV